MPIGPRNYFRIISLVAVAVLANCTSVRAPDDETQLVNLALRALHIEEQRPFAVTAGSFGRGLGEILDNAMASAGERHPSFRDAVEAWQRRNTTAEPMSGIELPPGVVWHDGKHDRTLRVTPSFPGIDKARQRGVVVLVEYCGPTCGGAKLLYFQLADNAWVVERTEDILIF
jgi:hypothetical protein